MADKHVRRNFLKAGTATAALAGLGDLSFLSQLSPVSAAESTVNGRTVSLDSGIEPMVRLIEETPRERLLEEVARKIQGGTSYREVLAGLLLAGVKNIEPRPSVGFKFHAVLVVNSAHLASQASAAEHRWLPIFWALDYYKSAAARDVRERGDWVMPAVAESSFPKAHQAHETFAAAMDNWDEEKADAAVAQLARTAGTNEIYEMLFRYGARDFRSIGHKAIYVANSLRTLHCIGSQHSEPVLRSLAYALLMHEGDNPAGRDAEADRPWRRNRELVNSIRADWRDGTVQEQATLELMQTLRTGSNDDACDHVVQLLNSGTSPQSIWDAFCVCAGEFLMRQPGIVALHAVTTTNALFYAYRTSANDETRRLLMLQNAAFLPMFRESMRSRGQIRDLSIDDLAAAEWSGNGPAEIFAELQGNSLQAARDAYGFLSQPSTTQQPIQQLMERARLMVFLKGNDAHDYKFSSAILEDCLHLSPRWRAPFLASNIFRIPASGTRDNPLVERTRAAFEA